MTVDIRRLRDAFGSFITGVTVVTANTADGKPIGFTANSFSSVSLTPPLLLVCPGRHLSSFETFNSCRNFAVNILAEDQRSIATRFAARGIEDRFADIQWARCDISSSPLISNTTAAFSCTTHQRIEAGDHLVLIGEVIHYTASGRAALGYANGGYFGITLERRADELTHRARLLTVGIIIEHNGKILMHEEDGKLQLPQVQVERHAGSLASLQTFLASAGISVAIGAVYSVVENPHTGAHSIYYRGSTATDDTHGLGQYYSEEQIAAHSAPSLAVMLRRYHLERQGGNFSLYIGDEHAGDVHLQPPHKGT